MTVHDNEVLANLIVDLAAEDSDLLNAWESEFNSVGDRVPQAFTRLADIYMGAVPGATRADAETFADRHKIDLYALLGTKVQARHP